MGNGSTPGEVLSVILPSVLLVFICTIITTIYRSKFEKLSWRYFCDFCIVAAPQIFNITVLVPHITEVIYFLLFLCATVTVLTYLNRKGIKYKHCDNNEHKDFITNVRATINLITVIAILAVDFKIFPNQFKKQLKYGYSLMDVGVGLFIYANAIVAPEIKTRRHSLRKSIIDTIPLIILGIGRYVATTVTHYSVSVTEYGAHWNFFITLAFTRIISSLLLTFVPLKFSFVYGVLILIIHEMLLEFGGLAQYVFGDAKRDNLFSANREGIISTLGFVALYFLSVAVGIWLNLKEIGISSRIKLIVKITIVILILLPTTFLIENRFGMSRRLANSAYCLWILFVGVFMTGLFYITEIFQKFLYEKWGFTTHIHVPFILEAINYNGLLYFLLANILTGFVNMSCDTLLVSPLYSLLILVVYLHVTSIVIGGLYVHKINLKLFIEYFTKSRKKSSNV